MGRVVMAFVNNLMLQSNELSHTATSVTPLLRDRWSPRNFDPTHDVSLEDLASVLTAAQWAPSAGNSQPWSFVVARRGDATHQLLLPFLSRGNQPWVPMASAVILAIAQVSSEGESQLAEYSSYASYDVGQAVAHLSLQARAVGLETRQFAGFDRAGVAHALQVPPHHHVLVGIALGRHLPTDLDFAGSTHTPRPRVRKDFSEFVFQHSWGNPWSQ